MNKQYKMTLGLLVASTCTLHADISGIVYQDLPVHMTEDGLKLNTYGAKDTNEIGVSGITVTAYSSNNTVLSTVITDENGSWSFNTTQNARIEFSNIPKYLKESPSIGVNNTSVQFIKNGDENVTFGLYNPKDYSNTTNPTYVNNLQQNGTHVGGQLQSLHFVDYAAKGLNNNYNTFDNHPGTGPRPTSTITVDLIGSVWGKAYQKTKKRLFVSSMLQRHVGYANDADSIYVIDYSNQSTGDNKVKHFSLEENNPNIDLGSITRDLVKAPLNPYPLTPNPLEPNTDENAYANVGKMSYGGIDIDYNSNTLWLINLHQKAIISHDISLEDVKNGDTKQYLMSGQTNLPTCNGGELRPWALKIHEGRGYIGAICDASEQNNTKDLSAHVFSFDINNPENGFINELDFDLNYTRQFEGWHPWQDTYVTPEQRKLSLDVFDQPILSDIEFDKDNNMYLAFIDRYATQLGNQNYTVQFHRLNEKAYSFGEILKVCNKRNTYQLEGTGECKKSNYTSINNNVSKLRVNEFFNDYSGSTLESSLGSLAILKGSQQLLNTSVSPHKEEDTNSSTFPKKYWNTQGVHTFSTKDGSIQNWYAHAMTWGNGLNGKANGLGDIELITATAPTEIGDRIWLDSNSNGIQDVNEVGIGGVTINLICNGAIVSTAITNSTGNYIFSNDSSSNLNSTSSHRYNIPELIENTDNCILSIPNIMGKNQQSSLNNRTLTSSNIGQGNNKTLNDSNAIINGLNAIVTINDLDIPISGHNNHSFDIGFKPVNPPVVNPPAVNLNRYTLGGRVWLDTNQNGIQDTNEVGVNGITANLYYNRTCTGNAINNTTTSNGFYQFTNLFAGDYCISFSNLPNDHNISSANQGSDNTSDSDANTNAQITHINLRNNDNSQDMGIYLHQPTTVVLGTTVCQEMIVNDDIQPANDLNTITTIDILNNDIGSKDGQEIKFLSLTEGKFLWENSEQNISSARLLDTLTVENEGTWSVLDNKIVFTALNSFNGQIPTPIYYVIRGSDCTSNTQFSNVGQVRINTPCHCPTYSTKSVGTLNIQSIALLLFLTLSISLILFKNERK